MQRRRFIQSLAGCASLAALAGCSTNYSPYSVVANNQIEKNNKRLYIDGLSFVPTDNLDIKSSQIDSYIADISAIEEIKLADGSINYKRTYQACMKSIKEKSAQMIANPDVYHIALKGSDIANAQQAEKCAVFLQIQGADCVEGSLEQVDEFHALGLRVLQ